MSATASPLRLFAGLSGWRNGNAGDEFSAPLIRALTGRDVEVRAEPEGGELWAAGSILHQLPADSTATVWGSGLIREEDRVTASGVTPIALRGPLTARRWAGCPDVPFGDPGLLVSRVWPAAPKRWRLGIVPHYIDAQHGGVAAFARRNQDAVTVIDICSNVADVMRSISECEAILSSSMHGLIFADSYGVPNGWIRLGDQIVGGSFKFRDYRMAVRGDTDPLPVEFTGGEPLEQIVSRIESAYQPFDLEPLGDSLVFALGLWLAEQAAVEACARDAESDAESIE